MTCWFRSANSEKKREKRERTKWTRGLWSVSVLNDDRHRSEGNKRIPGSWFPFNFTPLSYFAFFCPLHSLCRRTEHSAVRLLRKKEFAVCPFSATRRRGDDYDAKAARKNGKSKTQYKHGETTSGFLNNLHVSSSFILIRGLLCTNKRWRWFAGWLVGCWSGEGVKLVRDTQCPGAGGVRVEQHFCGVILIILPGPSVLSFSFLPAVVGCFILIICPDTLARSSWMGGWGAFPWESS